MKTYKKNSERVDAYEIITNKIIEAMKNNVCPWHMPWNGGNKYVSHTTGREYSFLNCMLLALSGKAPGEFITYAQAEKAGGHVKKGAKGANIYFYKQTVYTVKAVDENGRPLLDTDGNPLVDENGAPLESIRTGLVLKGYTVFSLDDVEGIQPKHTQPAQPSNASPIETAEAIINKYYNSDGAPTLNVQHTGQAYYNPKSDRVVVPELSQYDCAAEYY